MSEAIPPFDELPELTLSLRSFGSHRRLPNDDQALQEEQRRFFAPLLDARRTASLALTRPQAVVAFDARRLTALVDATIRAFAADRFAARAPARRAFESELSEIIDPLRQALQVLGGLAATITARVESPEQYERWTLWLAQLRVVFHVADSSWQPLCETLATAARAPAKAGWRRGTRGPERR